MLLEELIQIFLAEAVESVRRSGEAGVQAGYQRRTREVLNWARRRRHIRREELIAFLAGKTAPPRTTHLRFVLLLFLCEIIVLALYLTSIGELFGV